MSKSDENKPEVTVETHYQILVKCEICQSWTNHRVLVDKVFKFGLCDAHNKPKTVRQLTKTFIQE